MTSKTISVTYYSGLNRAESDWQKLATCPCGLATQQLHTLECFYRSKLTKALFLIRPISKSNPVCNSLGWNGNCHTASR